MISRTIQTTDGKIIINFPTTIDEISIGQMIDLQNGDLTDVETLSILSGTSTESLYSVRHFSDLGQFLEYSKSLGHQMKYPEKFKMPERVRIGGKMYAIPRDLTVEPVGAFLNCRNIIADQINEHIKSFGETEWKKHYQPSMQACLDVLCEYFYVAVTGKPYSEFKSPEYVTLIKTMPVTHAFPLARFFFLNYPDLLKQKIGFWRSLRMYWHVKLAQARLKRSSIIT